jgi:hypothetical protein
MKKLIRYLIIFFMLLIAFPDNIHADQTAGNQNPPGQETDKATQGFDDHSHQEKIGKPSGSIDIAPIPIIFYTPESSLALGGGVVMTFRDPDETETNRPDNLQVMTVYTLKNQAFISIAPNFYFNDTKGELNVFANYAKWPSSFFGIDNEADISPQDIDNLEETYMSESYMIQPWILHKVYSDFSIGMTFDIKQNMISGADKGSMIDQGEVEGHRGGLRSGMGPVFSWDTRDHIFYPTDGGRYKIWSWHYRDTMGSDFDYDLYAFDLRGYRSIAQDHVLAYQGIGVSTDGEVPFNELPTPLIRGLYQDVFVENNMLTLQVEYRFPIKNRWSGATFLAVGDVFRDGENYDINEIKYGGGGGIRYAISSKEKINLRFDIGVSRYGIFPYVMFQEAF